MSCPDPNPTGLEIAIVGMAGRFPGAQDVNQFWTNIRDGVESIRTYQDEELRSAGVAGKSLGDPAYVKAGAHLDEAECFDAELFGYSPREAEIIDPQQRQFLEIAWTALEDSGYDPGQGAGPVGVFASASLNNYLLNIYRSWMAGGAVKDLQPQLGNDKDYLATRVSYKLGLDGPSLSIQTACSSSLVAVHLACQALLAGDCDLALAGGVTVQVPKVSGYFHQPGGIFSPDGHCRAFDADASGTVFGSGVGAVVLKRLEEAQEDRDRIYAVIKGSAINNDGRGKVGFTAPGAEGQSRVVRAAQRLAEVSPDTISYVEAHGTGTPIGDPIEVEALNEAFRRETERKGYCALGSVKSNIGHLANAAGVAGLIKTAMALHHRQLPPTLHYRRPNPAIDFAASPFFVNAELGYWKNGNGPRRAGVSSFGVGGTNAHVILQEAPEGEDSGPSRDRQLFVLSAATEPALDRLSQRLGAHLKEQPEVSLADTAYTLAVGRKRLRFRRSLVVEEREKAEEQLLDPAGHRLATTKEEASQRPVTFLLPGQGSQYGGMGAGLYALEPVYREAVDRCAELLIPHLGLDLRSLLNATGDAVATASEALAQTRLTQPALFTVEYAMAQLLSDWGITPRALLGHSLGEYVAACLAEVFSLEDALSLVAGRGRLIQSLPAGSMVSVPLGEEDVAPYLSEEVSLAALNAAGMSVLSGTTPAIEALQERFTQDGVRSRPLITSHAFHSPMMDPVLEPFADMVSKVERKAPSVPVVSNVTGDWLTAEDAVDPAYWVRHLRQAVRFSEGFSRVAGESGHVFLELGPGRTLSSLARRHLDSEGAPPVVIPTLPHARGREHDQSFLLTGLGRLWMAGGEIDWQSFYRRERRSRVALPTYPFERTGFWVKPMDAVSETESADHARVPEEWFYTTAWKPVPAAPAALPALGGPALLFLDEEGLGTALVDLLEDAGVPVATVEPGTEFRDLGGARYTVAPGHRSDYDTLFEHLAESGLAPKRVFYFWCLGNLSGLKPAEVETVPSFFAPLFLSQALATARGVKVDRLCLVTNDLHEVVVGEAIEPSKSLLQGLVKVLPREFDGLEVLSLDLEGVESEGPQRRNQALKVLAESESFDPARPFVAHRARRRWRRDIERVHLEAAEGIEPLREGGVYLITGGLGGLGLALARHLAEVAQARLVLLGRTALPEDPAERQQILAAHGADHPMVRRLRAIEELEALGSEVLVLAADVADPEALSSALDRAEERFGPLHGVLHAAGVAGGGLAALKDPSEALGVLAPKVQGTRALTQVLGDDLDFLVLFSSTLALTGDVGQVDYCAANAFLDAFAHHHGATAGVRTLSVAWPRWREVGMAAASEVAKVDHPLLERRLLLQGGAAYEGRLSSADSWVLDEHRAGGVPVLPGTAQLEMVQAALADLSGSGVPVLEDVAFLEPFEVPEGFPRTALLLFARGETGYRFAVTGHGPGGLRVHATGRARSASAEEQAPVAEAKAARAADPLAVEELLKSASEGGLVTWGAHWQLSGTLHATAEEAWAELQLASDYVDECETFTLHPALLDVATACGLSLAGGGQYLPFSYRGVKVLGPLPPKVEVHLVSRHRDDESLRLDVSLREPGGAERVAITGYTLRRVGESTVDVAAPAEVSRPGVALPAEMRALAEQVERVHEASHDTTALAPPEALDALRRLLARPVAPHVAVSRVDLSALVRKVAQTTAGGAGAESAEAGARYGRPDLSSPYEAPRNELEKACADLWQGALALEEVGVHDNFFELGGHSLMAIQLTAQLGELFDMEITVADLFEHPTIAELVDWVGKDLMSGAEDGDLEAALAELEGLSEEEVAALLADEVEASGGSDD